MRVNDREFEAANERRNIRYERISFPDAVSNPRSKVVNDLGYDN
jgi:hypothetical protein